MTAFEFALYAAAIVAVLLLRAEATAATPSAPLAIAGRWATEADLDAEIAADMAEQAALDAEIAADLAAWNALKAEAATDLAAHAALDAEIAADLDAPAADEWEQELKAMATADLRRLCTDQGIVWRNARQGKHLTKAAMIAALMAV